MIGAISAKEADDFANAVFEKQEEASLGSALGQLEKGSHSLGAYVNEELVGVISVKITWENAHVTALALGDNYQGQGLGSYLLESMETWARAKGLTSMTLSTKSYQAKDFYLKQGYRLFGQLEDVPLKGVTKYHFVKYL